MRAVQGIERALRSWLPAPLWDLLRRVRQVARTAAAALARRRAGTGTGTGTTVAQLEASLDDVADRQAELVSEVARLRTAVGALLDEAVPVDGADGHLLLRVATGASTHAWITLGGGWDWYVVRRLGQVGLAEYEPATLATILALLEQPGSSFLDVGANVGLMSLVVASCLPDVRVEAFEPTPDLVARFRELVARNGVTVDVHQAALGEQDATLTLYISETDTSNSLRAGFRQAVGEIEVPVQRLDSWVAADEARRPTVIKVDTEATEPDVLRGAADHVRDHRPWVVVEVLHGRTEQALEAWCAEHDYHPHQLLDEGPVPRDAIVGDSTYEHLNWLLAPGPLPAAFHPSFSTWDARLRDSVTLDLRY